MYFGGGGLFSSYDGCIFIRTCGHFGAAPKAMVALVGQSSLLLHRRGERFHDGARADTAVEIRKESAHFLLQRTKKIMQPPR